MAGVRVLAVYGARCREGETDTIGGRIWGWGSWILVRACVRSCVGSAQRQPPTGGTPRDWVQARPVLQPRLAAHLLLHKPGPSDQVSPLPLSSSSLLPPPSTYLPAFLPLLAVVPAALDAHDDERAASSLFCVCVCVCPAPPSAGASTSDPRRRRLQASPPFYPLTDTAAVKGQARRRGATNTVLDTLKGTQKYVCFTHCGSALTAVRCCCWPALAASPVAQGPSLAALRRTLPVC